ncbi:MAG: hypothetical protein NXY57DRAFT_31183 [Lentinula lateritia]|nr:MAG: hypothetical protein NXY57DRAFT_31183 [Lentinula lateritia]
MCSTRRSNRSRKMTDRLLKSELLPSLSRTAGNSVHPRSVKKPSLSAYKFVDTEAAASEGNGNVSSADSESSFDKPDAHEVGSFVASNDIGDGSASPIDWPATPARPQNKIELPLIPDNAHHIERGVTDEHHPISTKEYSHLPSFGTPPSNGTNNVLP